mmetsp:Transcript_27507/g.41791  ORF Transcript_27507/g.41791 Transcript_27507/m.41791 type:complete len:122 (+) Transcript_27507:30-395(+)
MTRQNVDLTDKLRVINSDIEHITSEERKRSKPGESRANLNIMVSNLSRHTGSSSKKSNRQFVSMSGEQLNHPAKQIDLLPKIAEEAMNEIYRVGSYANLQAQGKYVPPWQYYKKEHQSYLS